MSELDWIEGDAEDVSMVAGVVACRESGEVAADWWIDDEDCGLIEHRAMDDEEREEQWSGVTHVEQLQQQLHVKEQALPVCCC